MKQTNTFQYIVGILLCFEVLVFGSVVPLREDRLPLASTVEGFRTTDDNRPDVLWTNLGKPNNEWIRTRSPVYRYQPIYDPSFQQMNSDEETNFENLAPDWQMVRENKRLQWPEEVPRHKKIPENEVWATPIIPGDPSDLRKPRMVLRRSYVVASQQNFNEDYARESSPQRPIGFEGGHSNLGRLAESNTDYNNSEIIPKSHEQIGGKKVEKKGKEGNLTRALETSGNRLDNTEAQRKLRELVSLIWKLHH